MSSLGSNVQDNIVVCGIGNSMRGDDGCGPYVVSLLSECCNGNDRLHAIDCGNAPENFIGKIKALCPTKIIIVDACELGKSAGSYEMIDISAIKGQMISTHKLPVSLFISFLESDIGCDIEFIGIQPKTIDFLEEMSIECVDGCKGIVDLIFKYFL